MMKANRPLTFTTPVKGTNNKRTTCAAGYHTSVGPINSTNACYAGYYDQILSEVSKFIFIVYYRDFVIVIAFEQGAKMTFAMTLDLSLCYRFNTCNKYNPIDYPSSIPIVQPPKTENTTRLVYDSYYGSDLFREKIAK